MQLIKTVFGLAALASMVAAQAGLIITGVPESVTAGQPATITWSGTTEPVMLTLRRGDANDLQTVSTLTSAGVNGQYTWTPDATLPSGTDYTIQISQGSQVNFSPRFTVVGAAASASSTVSSVASSLSSSASSVVSSMSSSASSVSASVSSHISSHVASYMSAASVNSTITSSTMTASTTIIPVPHTNSTMTKMNMTRTASSTLTESTAKSSPTASKNATTSATTTPLKANSAAGIASPLALVLTAFAAIVYLN